MIREIPSHYCHVILSHRMVIASASFLKSFIDLAMCLNAAAGKKQIICTPQKSFSLTDFRGVNAIPTKEKQQKVFQSLKVFYDSCY